MPRPGWLNRQFEKAARDVEQWPDWMKPGEGSNIEGKHVVKEASARKDHLVERSTCKEKPASKRR